MARFEYTTERKKESRDNFSNRNSGRGRRDFDDRPRRSRDSYRNQNSRNRSDVEMTKVICSSCGIECEVPFKPSSNKPVYCSDCFTNKNSSGKTSSKDFEIINEKLDKIMQALKIE